jgi:hypothetical protein
MDHDAIVGNGANQINGNAVQMSRASIEANRVARRAAALLTESSRARANLGVNIPTWTGKSGAAGRMDLTSSNAADGNSNTNSNGALARAIKEKLLAAGPKQAMTSEALVDAFSHADPASFKTALKSVAEKRKRPDGKMEWFLIFGGNKNK